MSSLSARKAISAVQAIQDANRRSAAAQLDSGEAYSKPEVEQAIVHGREDIGGLVVVAAMIYGELRLIKWIGIAIAALLVARWL